MNGAILCDTEIEKLATSGMITDFEGGLLSGASYDLRMGRECFTRGKTVMLDADQRPDYALEPGQFILLTSQEQLAIPLDVVGHAGLISRWAQRGLVSLFSPQIDPGFRGLIVVPLFNGGNRPVTLKLGEPMFTVEFARMTAHASRDWLDTHTPLTSIPAGVSVEMGQPDLSDITKRLGDAETKVTALEAAFAAHQTGLGIKHGKSGATAAWIGIAVAVVIGIAALVIAAIEAF